MSRAPSAARRGIAVAALAIAAALAVPAGAQTVGALTVSGATTRATSGKAGGGWLAIRNAGSAPDRLLSARSPVAERVELHTMRMEGDVMRMRQLDAIELPAGQTVELKPGGLHLMLMGLKAPLKAGERVPVTLRFEKAGELAVELDVAAAGAAPADGHKRHHGH